MLMPRHEAKRIIWGLSILVFLWFSSLYLIAFGPLLQDEEFEEALMRAEQVGIKDIQTIRDQPFWFIQRKEAVQRYVSLAQSSNMILYDTDICVFDDLDLVSPEQYDMIMLACGYRFFWWAKWWFHPDEYVTKAMSLVALMKWFYPAREFPDAEPYRDPFVNQAHSLWITAHRSTPYMMYLITKYELLLQLYRAYKHNTWTT